MNPLHLGHSISMSNSDNTGSSFCSDELDSSMTRLSFSSRVLGGTSLVRMRLDIMIVSKNDYYIPADDSGTGGS
jgi:hypothetical protein